MVSLNLDQSVFGQLLDCLLQLGTEGIRDAVLFPTPRLCAGLQAQPGVLRTVRPPSLRLRRQVIRENLRVSTRQSELVLRVLLVAACVLARLGFQLLREAPARLLRLLHRLSIQTEGLGLGLQAHEVRSPRPDPTLPLPAGMPMDPRRDGTTRLVRDFAIAARLWRSRLERAHDAAHARPPRSQ
jgi:hypothetical protein